MYNTPNLSTMGLSAAAIPLTLSNAVLQLAIGFVIVASYLLLVRRTGGLCTRDFTLSTEHCLSTQQTGMSQRSPSAERGSVPTQLLNNHDEVTNHDDNR
jgi:hypothetical protein